VDRESLELMSSQLLKANIRRFSKKYNIYRNFKTYNEILSELKKEVLAC
jgi:hypothetical protein